jgi:hypothetical protein
VNSNFILRARVKKISVKNMAVEGRLVSKTPAAEA